jgi:hypothetical protein
MVDRGIFPFKEKSPWQTRESNPGLHDQWSETLTIRPRGWSYRRHVHRQKNMFLFLHNLLQSSFMSHKAVSLGCIQLFTSICEVPSSNLHSSVRTEAFLQNPDTLPQSQQDRWQPDLSNQSFSNHPIEQDNHSGADDDSGILVCYAVSTGRRQWLHPQGQAVQEQQLLFCKNLQP